MGETGIDFYRSKMGYAFFGRSLAQVLNKKGLHQKRSNPRGLMFNHSSHRLTAKDKHFGCCLNRRCCASGRRRIWWSCSRWARGARRACAARSSRAARLEHSTGGSLAERPPTQRLPQRARAVEARVRELYCARRQASSLTAAFTSATPPPTTATTASATR